MEFKDFFFAFTEPSFIVLLRPLDIMNILAYFPTATPLSFVREINKLDNIETFSGIIIFKKNNLITFTLAES